MLDNVKSYLFLRDFPCNKRFVDLNGTEPLQDGTESFVVCEPRYQFNMAERIGNCLLAPIGKIFTTSIKDISCFSDYNCSDDTLNCCCISLLDSCLVKIKQLAYLVAGLFFTLIGIVGAAIKRLGECCNAKATLRKECLTQLFKFTLAGHQICSNDSFNPTDVMFSLILDSPLENPDLDTAFQTNIVDNGNKTALEKTNLQDAYKAIWAQIKAKHQTENWDLTPEKVAISQLTHTHPATEQALLAFINKIDTRAQCRLQIKQAQQAYTQAFNQMI